MAKTSTTSISSLLMAAVVCCWSMVTTAEGTLNHWATNRQQLNRIFPARPFLPFGKNDFPLNSDYDVSYDGRHLEMPSTEMMSVNPESRASGRFSRPKNFLSSGDFSATNQQTIICPDNRKRDNELNFNFRPITITPLNVTSVLKMQFLLQNFAKWFDL